MCQILEKVYHVTHIEPALEILKDGYIRAQVNERNPLSQMPVEK